MNTLYVQDVLAEVKNPAFRAFLLQAVEKAQHGDRADLQWAASLKRFPVSFREFVEGKDYLDSKGILFDKVMVEAEELNSGRYIECVLTGSIGCGKTTIALFTTAYQLYLLSCFKDPHTAFGLDPNSEIVFIFQSLNADRAQAVDYNRFKSMIQRSPYFRTVFPPSPYVTSKLVFPHRIEVKPISGDETGAIGENVFGGVIDEVNFMKVVEKSTKAEGGVYDQAMALYNSIVRRRKSRFNKGGKLPGMLCLVSSKRYPGQFTDIKTEEAMQQVAETGTTSVFIYDKCTWDIRPVTDFSGQWFQVFVGDDTRKPRILNDGEQVVDADRHLVKDVPLEYRDDFKRDIMGSLRDIAGVSILSKYPFIMDRDLGSRCFAKVNLSSLTEFATDFRDQKLAIRRRGFSNPDKPRWVHIDLGITGDSAGVVMGHIDKFVAIPRSVEMDEILPHIKIDFSLEVQPPRGGEILFYKIRELLYKISELDVNIKWITLDSFQSTDMMQIMRQKGYLTGYQSLDKTTAPYDLLKTTLYDGRLSIPEHPKLIKEVFSLERDLKKNKIDHPTPGSKDISDALAGVVWGLTMRRELWIAHGIPPTNIPASVMQVIKTGKDNMKQAETAPANPYPHGMPLRRIEQY